MTRFTIGAVGDSQAADIAERKFWPQYMQAYEHCLSATSTDTAPWYVVPADVKRNAELIIFNIVFVPSSPPALVIDWMPVLWRGCGCFLLGTAWPSRPHRSIMIAPPPP